MRREFGLAMLRDPHSKQVACVQKGHQTFDFWKGGKDILSFRAVLEIEFRDLG